MSSAVLEAFSFVFVVSLAGLSPLSIPGKPGIRAGHNEGIYCTGAICLKYRHAISQKHNKTDSQNKRNLFEF